AIVGGVTGAAGGLLGQAMSPGKTVSVTVQLVRSAVALLVTLTVKLLVADPPHCATVAGHCFITVRPGVRHWKVAESKAVALTVVVPFVQAQFRVAVSACPVASD